MARLWAAKEDLAKSEEWLKKAVTTHPSNPAAHRAYAGYLLDDGRADAAAVYIESASKLDPTGKDTAALRGLLARYRKDYAAAESTFETLVKERPEDAFPAWNLALALAGSADDAKHKRAVAIAEAEVRRSPRAAEGYAVLGWCYYRAGRIEDADKALGQAAAAGRVQPDTAYYMAKLLADKGKEAEAQTLLRGAVTGRGPFAYRTDAVAMLAELDKKLPPKK
jgi:tetratricopeptide (TPR) repeat protein